MLLCVRDGEDARWIALDGLVLENGRVQVTFPEELLKELAGQTFLVFIL